MKNDDLAEKIVEKIRKNLISTTEVADCLGKTGNLEGIMPINGGLFRAGKISMVYAYEGRNWNLHKLLQDVPPGNIVLVATHNNGTRAVFGELVSKFLLLYRKSPAIVVKGYMRDAPRLRRMGWPIWCEGVTPIGCQNTANEKPIDSKILEAWKAKYEGGIAVCDDSGVVVIPKEKISEKFLEKLDFIELQEDIWFYCIDTKKWDTYKTVCQKEYKDTKLLPEELRDKFNSFEKGS